MPQQWTPEEWIRDALGELARRRSVYGNDAAAEVERTDLDKRQTVFERDAVQWTRKNLPPGFALQAEGWKFICPEPAQAQWIIGLDPTDGTAGDARFRGVGVLQQSLPLSLVISVRENVPNPTFASVKHAGILDLRTYQKFTAGPAGMLATSGGAWTQKTIKPVAQYNLHAPAIACELARRANAFIRFLIPYGLYPEIYSDSNSSAMVMLWSLLGYCDVWFNCELPGITGAGQRGHELGAIAVFARALGSCAYHTRVSGGQIDVRGKMDDAPYSFDGQTSVMLGVDHEIVGHYVRLINESLRKTVQLGDQTVPVHEMLAALNAAVPDERWSLPLVTSST